MTQLESIVAPGCVTDRIGRESTVFEGLHAVILPLNYRSIYLTVRGVACR